MKSQLETTQTVSALKLPVLKTRENDLWSMRMEQYLTFTDHALWEVIVNGDSVSLVASTSVGAEGPILYKTAEQKLARKKELKTKGTLMLAIPNEHLLKFHTCKDAKSLWEAIKNRIVAAVVTSIPAVVTTSPAVVTGSAILTSFSTTFTLYSTFSLAETSTITSSPSRSFTPNMSSSFILSLSVINHCSLYILINFINHPPLFRCIILITQTRSVKDFTLLADPTFLNLLSPEVLTFLLCSNFLTLFFKLAISLARAVFASSNGSLEVVGNLSSLRISLLGEGTSISFLCFLLDFFFSWGREDDDWVTIEDMFGVNDLDGDEVVVDVSASEKVEQSVKVVEKEVSIADPITTGGEVVAIAGIEVATAGIEVTTAVTTPQISKDELTMAQTLIEIKAAKPKAIITVATIVTAAGTRPKEKGIVMQEPSETPSNYYTNHPCSMCLHQLTNELLKPIIVLRGMGPSALALADTTGETESPFTITSQKA
nr:hypothetical protein [Tanacetum cinerariifolium]